MSDSKPRILAIDLDDLASLLRRIDDFEYGRDGRGCRHPPPSYFIDIERLQKIGQAANEAGGFSEMYRISMEAARHYRNAVATLNHHWHGIGHWEE